MPIKWSGMATEGAQQDEVCRLREKLRRARDIVALLLSECVEELKRRLYESRDYTSTAMAQRSVELRAQLEIVERHFPDWNTQCPGCDGCRWPCEDFL